ncbi:Secreted protein acidic and rich in cysteine Ca binding region, variant 2 [Globodera pallida]|nr:Secreted protein acidic and rich in cysteine Ca binding region, variant 2 [Globodera pallida]
MSPPPGSSRMSTPPPFLSLLIVSIAMSQALVQAIPRYVDRFPRQSAGGGGGGGDTPRPSPSPSPLQNHFPSAVAANSSRAAFASKLVPSTVDDAGQIPRHQPTVPQFVANNGPLIRAPDGQFVLASVVPQQQQSVSFTHGQIQPIGLPSSRSTNDSDQLSPSVPPIGDVQAEMSPPPDESTPANPTADTLSPSPPASPLDKSVDLDGDGALSLGEVQYAAFVHHGLSSSVVENLFNEVDHNKDGYLNSPEFNDIRPLVLAKAENAALRYLQNVDTDHNGLLSLSEAQGYILKEYGISNRDVERIWRLVVPSSGDEMDAMLFSKLRRRIRGMSIRLARQIMKGVDRDEDGHINLKEAQLIAFEQEGIGPGDVVEMLASVDDNNDGQLNAPEFADFERIVRARAVETSKKALKVVDTDGNSALTMDEAKKIAFEHYGFDEVTLEPFFAQADENEDAQLDPVEFAGFRSVIRGRAVKNAGGILPEMDEDGDGMVSEAEAEQKTRQEDDMNAAETHGLFVVADQDKNGLLDKVELADFIRLVRLTAIKFVADHFSDYDLNRDKLVTLDELETLVRERYKLGLAVTRKHFNKADLDRSGDLNAGEIVDFRHETRRFTQDKAAQTELDEQNRREIAVIRKEAEEEQNQQEDDEENEGEGEERRQNEQKHGAGAGHERTDGHKERMGLEQHKERMGLEQDMKKRMELEQDMKEPMELEQDMKERMALKQDMKEPMELEQDMKERMALKQDMKEPMDDGIPNHNSASIEHDKLELGNCDGVSLSAPADRLPIDGQSVAVVGPIPDGVVPNCGSFEFGSLLPLHHFLNPRRRLLSNCLRQIRWFCLVLLRPQLPPQLLCGCRSNTQQQQQQSQPPPQSSSASPATPSSPALSALPPLPDNNDSPNKVEAQMGERNGQNRSKNDENSPQQPDLRTSSKGLETTTTASVTTSPEGAAAEGKKRHRKRRRKTTVTTTTTTTTEAPTEEENDDYEEEEDGEERGRRETAGGAERRK